MNRGKKLFLRQRRREHKELMAAFEVASKMIFEATRPPDSRPMIQLPPGMAKWFALAYDERGSGTVLVGHKGDQELSVPMLLSDFVKWDASP